MREKKILNRATEKEREKANAIRENIFACLFSIHNMISLSCHEQVCLRGFV